MAYQAKINRTTSDIHDAYYFFNNLPNICQIIRQLHLFPGFLGNRVFSLDVIVILQVSVQDQNHYIFHGALFII